MSSTEQAVAESEDHSRTTLIFAEDLNTQLLEAAKENSLERVIALCGKGASASYVFKEEGTWGARHSVGPLHHALDNNNLEMVRFLLEHGAKPDSLSERYDWRGCGHSQTAFEKATDLENPQFVLAFLRAGANPNLVSRSDTHSMRTDGTSTWTLLHSATERGSLVLVDALLTAGADLSAIKKERYHNERGYNRASSQNALHIACLDQNTPVVKRLLQEAKNNPSFDVNAAHTSTRHDPNPAHAPTADDNPRADGYISPVICRQVSQTALHIAIAKGNQELFDLLVNHGAGLKPPFFDGLETIATDALCAKHGINVPDGRSVKTKC